jgi:nucleoside-diphosphate-sugar epimerase
MQQQKVFVTGGTGLVGSHLIAALLHKGNHVVALVRDSSKTGLVNKVAGWYFPDEKLPWEHLSWLQGDVMNLADLMEAMEGCDTVYHCAATVSFNPAQRNAMLRNNVDGTANVVDAAIASSVKSFCQVSSIAALGSGDADEVVDENTPRNPGSAYSGYSISKFYSELEVWRGFHLGLPVVIVNPGIILGPGDWHKGSSSLIHQIGKGMPFYTSGTGAYVDVRDVVEAMMHLLGSDIRGERFCLSPHHLSYKDFFTRIALLLDKKPPTIQISYPVLRFAARLMRLASFFSGKEPLITRESAKSAFSSTQYSSEKIVHQTQFSFRSMDETLKYCTDAYQKDFINSKNGTI